MKIKKTAYTVASENSTFLLALTDELERLSIDDRIFLRRKILEHNEKNLAIMKQSITKSKKHEKSDISHQNNIPY